jgi:hypothetical protein
MRTRSSRRFLHLLALCAISPLPALADTFTWDVSNGNYDTAGSWTPDGPPVSGDIAQFSSAGTHTVIFTSNPASSTLDVTAGDATFVASGATRIYTVTTASAHGGDLTLLGGVQQMQLSASTLSVFNNSTLSVEDLSDVTATTLNLAAATSGTSGTLRVVGANTSLTVSGLTNLGQNGGTANLTLESNTSASFANITTVSSANALSAAHIIVRTGATATSSGNLSLGPSSVFGQASTFLVTGTNTAFTQSGATNITLGASTFSNSALDINSNGTFTTGTGLLTINPTGTLTIGGGTLNANGNITVSGLLQHATGTFLWATGRTMNVLAGGTVNINAVYTTPVNAIINITGANAEFNVITASTFDIRDGAQVTVTAGGKVTSSSLLHIGRNANGTVIIDGANSSISALAATSSILGNGAGTGTLTIRNNASGNFVNGGLTLGGISGSGILNVQSGATLSVGPMTVGLSANVGTSGIINLSGGSISLSGASTLIIGGGAVSSGQVNITGGAFHTGTGSTTVAATGILTINSGTFHAHGNVQFATGSTLTIGGTTDNWIGNLDIHASKLVFKATPATKAALLATLQNQVNYGKSHPAGITTSTPPGAVITNTAVAVIDNGALAVPFTTFAGILVNSSSIMVASELLGDANIDGTVNFNDFIILTQNFGQTAGWVKANFDTDSTTGFSDFIILSQHFGQTFNNPSNLTITEEELAHFQAAAQSFFATQNIPEPTTLTLFALGTTALFRRKNR